MSKREIIDARALNIALNRLCCKLIENHGDFSNSILIGMQPRGVQVLDRLVKLLESTYGVQGVRTGVLDITFFRDDFRRRESPINASPNDMSILIEGKKVILIDDVLYTGRSVRAALDALGDYGRPAKIELCVLVDRRFSRELPIQPDYSGHRVDAISNEKVKLDWSKENSLSVLIENTPDA